MRTVLNITKALNKVLALAVILSLGVLCASAQKVECIGGEYFWGVSSSYGQMPMGGSMTHHYGLSDSVKWNLSSPVLVSNKGRYILNNGPVSADAENSVISFDETVNVVSAGKTLRQSYLIAISKMMKPDGVLPPKEIFNTPFYNTWAGLGTSLSQSHIEDYVSGILSHSLNPGTVVIDNGWQSHNGSFDFDHQRFQEPDQLVSVLHSKGFKVMLQISPIVSLDCLEFSEFKNAGMLEKNNDGSVRLVSWYGGISAVMDLSSEQSVTYIKEKLEYLKSRYNIDGFKFDYLGACDYSSKNEYLKRITPWTELVSRYPYNQVLETYKSKNYSSIIGHLQYREQNWNSLKSLVSEAINAGLCGHPFVVSEAVGGGFGNYSKSNDSKLIVRQAQLQAFLPSMQFSMAFWNELPNNMMESVRNAQKLHESLSDYIMDLVKTASTSGEPIIRSMEYVFPNKGFYDCTDQFMLGNKYLIAPVLSADNSRTVRLPAGTWIDDQGRKFKGPAVIKVNVPIERNLYFTASKEIKTK